MTVYARIIVDPKEVLAAEIQRMTPVYEAALKWRNSADLDDGNLNEPDLQQLADAVDAAEIATPVPFK